MRFRRPPRTPIGKLEPRSNAGCAPDRRAAKRILEGPFRWKRGQASYSSRAGSAETFLPRPGTGVVSPHYVLEGRHRNPAVPIKAMRCNARMALIVLETELVHFNLRTGTDTMPLNEEGFIARVAIRHSVSADAVHTILRALRSGGGSMAQFSHSDFGGMSQWAPGMTMVGDMFNNSLKSKLDAVCTELAAYVAETPSTDRGRDRAGGEVSYRAEKQAQIGGPPDSERRAQLANKMTFGMRYFLAD
jgi:hypothetical protein